MRWIHPNPSWLLFYINHIIYQHSVVTGRYNASLGRSCLPLFYLFICSFMASCSILILNQCTQKDLEKYLHTTRLQVSFFFFLSHVNLIFFLLKLYVFPGHYKWALDALFNKHNFNRVIILEGMYFSRSIDFISERV